MQWRWRGAQRRIHDDEAAPAADNFDEWRRFGAPRYLAIYRVRRRRRRRRSTEKTTTEHFYKGFAGIVSIQHAYRSSHEASG